MSADKALRLDLLDVLLGAEPSVRTLPYRGHVLEVSLTGHGRDAALLVDGDYAFLYNMHLRDGITELLVIFRDLDYLIDILNAVNEPALKGD